MIGWRKISRRNFTTRGTMKLPSILSTADWPLAITSPYWLLTPKPQLDKRGRSSRIFRRFPTTDARAAWLAVNNYQTVWKRTKP